MACPDWDIYDEVEAILDNKGVSYIEGSLWDDDRDFTIKWRGTTVALYLRTDGTPPEVLRHMKRNSSEVDAVLLLTTRGRHKRLPNRLGELPLEVCCIA